MDDANEKIEALRQEVAELARALDFTITVAMTALNALRREDKITPEELKAIVEAGDRSQRPLAG